MIKSKANQAATEIVNAIKDLNKEKRKDFIRNYDKLHSELISILLEMETVDSLISALTDIKAQTTYFRN